jgi:hypothetical protein
MACGGQDATTLAGAELGQTEQELTVHVGGFDPQQKHGVFYEQGPFHQFGVGTFAFGAYVYWQGNDFAVVGAFGSITVDLTQPDASTFPAANPAQPILYEYAEDADCDWVVSLTSNRVLCEATEHVFFTPPGVPGFSAPFNWKMTRLQGDSFYSFNSGDPNGNRVDAFNYRVLGAECEAALERMSDFFDAQDVEFEELELDPEVCE